MHNANLFLLSGFGFLIYKTQFDPQYSKYRYTERDWFKKRFYLAYTKKGSVKKICFGYIQIFSKSNELSNTIRKHEDTIKSKNYELFLVETYLHTVPKTF